MALLDDLFPGINKLSNSLPKWENPDCPWNILADGSMGLESQIRDLEGNEEGIVIHPSASIGNDVEIEPPTFIGPMAEIRHGAYLRKGSWICEGAIVGHSSEVKNSLLMPGSKAPHFNYVGDSILGFGSNIGAGVKLANVRNDSREIVIQLEDGSWEKTGLRKLGALIGDNCKIGCNVVTNPGTIISPGHMIGPNETVSGWIS